MNQSKTRQHLNTVLFDLDDTLIDWSGQEVEWADFTRPMMGNIYDYLAADGHALPGRDEFYNHIIEEIQNGWEEAKLTWSGLFFDRILSRAYARCHLDVARIDVEATMRVYDWQPVPGVVPYPETRRVLDQLRDRGLKLGLLTNSMFPMWMRDIELETYGLLPYFPARVSAGDTGDLKPNPAIYHHLLDKLGTTPETAIFVGDRPENDIAGANATGLTSVLLSPPHLERALDGVQPDFIITTLNELLPIIEKMNKLPQT
jgi:putative hydrolase of the HAD superfamily